MSTKQAFETGLWAQEAAAMTKGASVAVAALRAQHAAMEKRRGAPEEPFRLRFLSEIGFERRLEA